MGEHASPGARLGQVLDSRVRRLFARIAGGRGQNSGSRTSPELCASARPPATFSQELADAIDSAILAIREPGDDGRRVAVLCRALGAFIFDPDEADRRIRRAFPELSNAAVRRGVRHLSSRVSLASAPQKRTRRPSWIRDYIDFC